MSGHSLPWLAFPLLWGGRVELFFIINLTVLPTDWSNVLSRPSRYQKLAQKARNSFGYFQLPLQAIASSHYQWRYWRQWLKENFAFVVEKIFFFSKKKMLPCYLVTCKMSANKRVMLRKSMSVKWVFPSFSRIRYILYRPPLVYDGWCNITQLYIFFGQILHAHSSWLYYLHISIYYRKFNDKKTFIITS